MVGEKPSWLRIRPPTGPRFQKVREICKEKGLRTVCDASHCPNISDCWSQGNSTFLLMGPNCARRCSFCAIGHGPLDALDESEPRRVAEAVRDLTIEHVVLTSVTRDDLPDQGSEQFARTIAAIRALSPLTTIEVLVPDFNSERKWIERVVRSHPNVFGHNIETVKRLQSEVRDRRASYEGSLAVLEIAKTLDASIPLKSSLMLGLGEKKQEVAQTMVDLREVGVDLLTIGQYLRPKGAALQVQSYIYPDDFDDLKEMALSLGFKHAASGPFVRSSYQAAEALATMMVNKDAI